MAGHGGALAGTAEEGFVGDPVLHVAEAVGVAANSSSSMTPMSASLRCVQDGRRVGMSRERLPEAGAVLRQVVDGDRDLCLLARRGARAAVERVVTGETEAQLPFGEEGIGHPAR